jgi:hypothetical protein
MALQPSPYFFSISKERSFEIIKELLRNHKPTEYNSRKYPHQNAFIGHYKRFIEFKQDNKTKDDDHSQSEDDDHSQSKDDHSQSKDDDNSSSISSSSSSSEENMIPDIYHRLSVVCLYPDFDGNEQNIDNLQDEFREAHDNNKYEIFDVNFLLFEIEITKDDKISITMFLPGSQVECDTSFPVFTYDEVYQCWIIKEADWDCEGGIQGGLTVWILSFDGYLKEEEEKNKKK